MHNNATRTISGWFFDAYPVQNGMRIWIIDEEGEAHAYFHPFQPVFYLHLDAADGKRLPALVQKLRLPVTVSTCRKRELFSGEEWNVTALTVHNPLQLNPCVWSLQKFFPHFVFYNSNIPVAQMYLYEHQLFPLARCRFSVTAETLLQEILLEDSFDSKEYVVPSLKIMKLENTAGGCSTKFHKRLELQIAYEGTVHSIEQTDPTDVLETLNWHLYHYDPDVILTSWGDATLLPTLVGASQKYGIPLSLNRDESNGYFLTKERSYWTYGQVMHRDGAFMLAGRWHVDNQNSFFMEESDLEGNIEIARLAQVPMQKQSRSSIGTGLASMQMSYAYRKNILIPAEKKEGEDFKTADDLLLSDRGGLVFLPEPGYHENVAELDFASMYPSLMEVHNISPETINCNCCQNHAVPELGYSICEKRRGIVPTTLRPVIEKRAYYKQQRNKATTRQEYQKYDRRQNALKWMLVTCFGYLGYKNARFGRIEAHEAVNAFSRDALLTAKEIAEERGYHLVHAIIDCLWLKKSGATEQQYRELCEEIKSVVGVPISLEGIYRWILFPSSKTDAGIPTSGKYVGWYRHGDIKMRGIEARRKDVPFFIQYVQKELLQMLSEAETIADIRNTIPTLLQESLFYLRELRSGRVNPNELIIRRRIQKEADQYVHNSLNAMVVKELAEYGVHLQPGEQIEYVIIDQSGKRDPRKARSLMTYRPEDGYDIEKYTELFLKGIETLLSPFGYDLHVLREHFGVNSKNLDRAHKRPTTLEKSQEMETIK